MDVTSSPPIIAADGISKRFVQRRGGRREQIAAVADVSLSVSEGEIVGLVGESGSGKSTLSRILIGIETPDAGDVRHEGTPVVGRSAWRRLRRDVQYVFQDPFGSLPPKMRVGDILTDPLRIHGVARRTERTAIATEMLQHVGLDAKAMSRTAGAFSGGQRQRISIARALILRPRVVICDEVVSGLDVSVQAQVLNLLLDLHERFGLALLFISHDLRVIQYLCRRVVVMHQGVAVESGRTTDVLERPTAAYTRQLVAATPSVRIARASSLRDGVRAESAST